MLLERRMQMKSYEIVLTGLPLAQAIANVSNVKTINTANHTAVYNHSVYNSAEQYNRTILQCDGIHQYEVGLFIVKVASPNSSIGFMNKYGNWKRAFKLMSNHEGLLIVGDCYGDPPPQRIVLSYYESGNITYDYEKSFIRIVK